MADRKTIYLPDDVAAYLGDAQNGLSSRISAIVRRYEHLVRQSLPELTRNEWCAISDANNGCDDLLLGDHPSSAKQMIWANVADSIELGEKWEIDQDALVAKLRGLSICEAFAVYEAVRTFWLHADQDTDAAMKQAGMIGGI